MVSIEGLPQAAAAVASPDVASFGADSVAPKMLPVTPIVSTESSEHGAAAPKMLPVASVLSTESSDGNGSLDDVTSSDLPFTHAAPTDTPNRRRFGRCDRGGFWLV